MVLAGTVSADPVLRRMPSGDEVTKLRLSVPVTGKRLLPLPITAWHATPAPERSNTSPRTITWVVHGHLSPPRTPTEPGLDSSEESARG